MKNSDRSPNLTANAPNLLKLQHDERVVEAGFWPKIRKTLGKIPFLEDALAGYYCARDRATPAYVRAIIYSALAYFVVPTDLIPDFIAGLGYTDDATVLMAAISAVQGHLTDDHRSKAKAFLMDDAAPGD